jgi:hypothetical protein
MRVTSLKSELVLLSTTAGVLQIRRSTSQITSHRSRHGHQPTSDVAESLTTKEVVDRARAPPYADIQRESVPVRRQGGRARRHETQSPRTRRCAQCVASGGACNLNSAEAPVLDG